MRPSIELGHEAARRALAEIVVRSIERRQAALELTHG